MNVLTAEQAEDLLSLQQVTTELGVELVVIGAVAYRAFVSGTQRSTEDIDVALVSTLTTSACWKPNSSPEVGSAIPLESSDGGAPARAAWTFSQPALNRVWQDSSLGREVEWS